MRRIFQQLRLSEFPRKLGLCVDDIPALMSVTNDIIERLVYYGGDSGWWGGWAKVGFSLTQTNPYLTLPPQFARIINLAVCNMPIRVQNEFYEIMEASIGLQPPTGCADWCGALEGFERGVYSTMADLPATGEYYLRAYMTYSGDVGKRVLIQGALDQNGVGIYDVDADGPTDGTYLTLDSPFVTTSSIITGWSGIAKDITVGDVVLKAVDSVTGVETTLSRYLPWETNPAYRRYYVNSLPQSCCRVTGSNVVTVTAMCKYEFRPIIYDTDQLLISNFPALTEEGLAIQESEKEDGGAAEREGRHHARAIRLLQAEMTHYLGKKQPAVNFAPFGTAKLERKLIGQLR